mmetsp:Transcript_117352/g.230240  ORF Transcript_117352/g.230240 Transcript_117352/m.230240 type:complete len:232 (-) Transcript_117352:613-1308(-)
MDGNAVLFTNFSTLSGNSQSITVLETNVKISFIVVDKFEIGWWVKGEGSLVALGQGDDIIDARVGRGITSSTLTDQCRGKEIARGDFYRVGGSIDSIQGIVRGNITRRNKGGDLVGSHAFGKANQFDTSTHHFGIFKVQLAQFGDTLAGNVIFGHFYSIGQSNKNLELRSSIESTHIEGRIFFGITQFGCFRQGFIVGFSITVHGCQHKVGASIDDSTYHLNVIPDKITLE